MSLMHSGLELFCELQTKVEDKRVVFSLFWSKVELDELRWFHAASLKDLLKTFAVIAYTSFVVVEQIYT